MRDKQYGVVFGHWNANVCKRRINKRGEEPAVRDAINKITLVKSSKECHLTLCWFTAKMQCLFLIIRNI